MGRDWCSCPLTRPRSISIHAPRMGRDLGVDCVDCVDCISIHAPRMGRDCRVPGFFPDPPDFNPRAPYGARLVSYVYAVGLRRHFNPRAPCGARRYTAQPSGLCYEFQSTRPMRGATINTREEMQTPGFQSTRPMRGATIPMYVWQRRADISIHAPHAGRDREPHGHAGNNEPISIHAPHAGRDHARSAEVQHMKDFNPRAPCGARHFLPARRYPAKPDFNPRAPCGARLRPRADRVLLSRISIHAPHAGRDNRKNA
mgnify:CR=1 FL=1